MTTEITLTDKQRELLHRAGSEFAGQVLPAAETLRLYGGARLAMVFKLKEEGLVEGAENQEILTAFAYALLAQESLSEPADSAAEVFVAEAEPPAAQETSEETQIADLPAHAESAKKVHKVRENTKQSMIIELLKRPEGATLPQIIEATGWQIHTARSVLSRTIQRDLGIQLISEKTTGNDRIYRAKA